MLEVRRAATALFLALTGAAMAEEPEAPPIQDNSFLVEEAYNQERGVVQHIQHVPWDSKAGGWAYTFPRSGRCRT